MRQYLALFVIFGIALAQTYEHCDSVNYGKVVNECLKLESTDLFFVISKHISKWFSPKIQSVITQFLFILLPFIMLYGSLPSKFQENLKEFGNFKIEALHFLHRIGKTLLFIL